MNFLSDTSPSTEPADQSADRGPSRLAIYRDLILGSAVILVVALDQLTKFLVRANMKEGQSIPSDGFFRITYYENSGTIFGLFPNATVVLTVISILAIGFLVYFYRSQHAPTPVMRIAIGILLGGAVGNLIDRLAMGEVTDFVDVGRWPIFNVADASITLGIFLLIVMTSLVPSKDKAGEETEQDADGPLVGEHGDQAS